MTIDLVKLGRERFFYDSETGVLTWRDPGPESFATLKGYRIFKKKFAGKTAGSLHKQSGYWKVFICGRSVLAHRLIWAIVYGKPPTNDIDHIDLDKTNNRISNLREATRQENTFNRPAHVTSKTKIKGVFFHKASGKWAATITKNGKAIWLGVFNDINDAVRARTNAGISFHGVYRKETLEHME